jgi:hypothetical protein
VLLVVVERDEDLVDARDELVALAPDDLELLLDPEAVEPARAVVYFQLSPPEKAGLVDG